MKKDKVYYDGDCYVCSIEIGALRKRGEQCGIEFINIADKDFDNPDPYMTEMIGEFDGKETIGPETFRKMYETIGFKKLVWLTRLPIIKQIVDYGYHLFAHYLRQWMPRKKIKHKILS
jgi:predicted DCC family thiol-disulfide oxidoreductase YuxK